jgi:FkbM family methyltransferase
LLKRTLLFAFGPLMVPIRGGPLAGKKWGLVTGIRYLRGTYEPEHTRVFQEIVGEGAVVYDVGAHVGYYSVLASDLVGPRGCVAAFEPLPFNVRHLRRHLRVNACENVVVVDACVGEWSGTARFQPAAGTGSGHMSETGPLSVRMVSVDALVRSGELPAPDCVKIDAEGAEHLVLKGAQSVIGTARPAILLSLHGDGLRQQCSAFLADRGYELRSIDARPLAQTRTILATPGT